MLVYSLFILAATGQVVPPPLSSTIDATKRVPVGSDAVVIVANDAIGPEVAWVEDLNTALGVSMRTLQASSAASSEFSIYVGEAGRHAAFESRRLRRALEGLSATGPQGYRLVIERGLAVVVGGDRSGTLNGIQTLRQLAGQDGTFPTARIRDEPGFTWRGVRLTGPPSETYIRELAAMKCNLAIIESADWWTMDRTKANAWGNTFATLRRYGIEPVPAIDPLANAEPLLQKTPAAAIAQIGIDQIVLAGNTWAELTNRNVIHSESAPILVRQNGVYFQEGVDFEIESGDTMPPFAETNRPWRIRRTHLSGIADGAIVDVLFGYATPGTAGICPIAIEAREAMTTALRELVHAVQPAYVHIGHAAFAGIDRDIRVTAAEKSSEAVFAESIAFLSELLSTLGEGARIMMFADAFDPGAGLAASTREAILNELPETALLEVRARNASSPIDGGTSPDLDWVNTLQRNVLAAPPPGAMPALAWSQAAKNIRAINGIVSNDAGAGALETLALAWGPAQSTSSWTAGLNELFHTQFVRPTDQEAFEAIVAHLNRATVNGIRPEAALQQFRNWLTPRRSSLAEADVALVDSHYQRLTEWVALEYEHGTSEGGDVLRRLTNLVERYTAAIPEYPAERKQTILDTIQSEGRFVPSTILFGAHVLPYRPITLPGSHAVLEIPGKSEFLDRERETEARFDLMDIPGPVIRIDFETLSPSRITVARSRNGQDFEALQSWTNTGSRLFGPPLFMQRPFLGRWAAITVASESRAPVLRNPRLFGLKDVPVAICGRGDVAPVLDGSFREEPWPNEAQVTGFVDSKTGAFASVPTTVRLVRTVDTLFIGVYAMETRMETLVASMTQQDSPVWEEEAVEIQLAPGSDRYRFAVNAAGTRYDDRNGAPSWNGNWASATARFSTGWTVEMAIPLATVGGQFSAGDDWQFDVIRYRKNVEQSSSKWAFRKDEGLNVTGRLIFE